MINNIKFVREAKMIDIRVNLQNLMTKMASKRLKMSITLIKFLKHTIKEIK